MDTITNRFLELFYEILQIPREYGKEKRIADFLENFAKKNNLKCDRDKNNNVLIKKSVNKQNNEIQILQAHTDMVRNNNTLGNKNIADEQINQLIQEINRKYEVSQNITISKEQIK